MSLEACLEVFWRALRSEVSAEALGGVFREHGRLSVANRLRVYRTAHWVRQVNVLRELFPHVVEVLGDGPFAQTASRYLGAHPSTEPAIELIGAGFPAWLRVEHEAVAPLAEWDLATWQVFIAPDVAPLSIDVARQPGFERATLRLGPHVRTVTLNGEVLAIWREAFHTLRQSIHVDEQRAIERARAGAPLSELCALIGGDASLVFQTLARWFERGWVVSFEVAS